MAVIRCEEITGIECAIVFDGDWDMVAPQMIAHAKGSHGLFIGEDDIRTPKPKVEEDVVEVVEEVSIEDLTYKELVKLAKKEKLYKRGMRKADLIEALG